MRITKHFKVKQQIWIFSHSIGKTGNWGAEPAAAKHVGNCRLCSAHHALCSLALLCLYVYEIILAYLSINNILCFCSFYFCRLTFLPSPDHLNFSAHCILRPVQLRHLLWAQMGWRTPSRSGLQRGFNGDISGTEPRMWRLGSVPVRPQKHCREKNAETWREPTRWCPSPVIFMGEIIPWILEILITNKNPTVKLDLCAPTER